MEKSAEDKIGMDLGGDSSEKTRVSRIIKRTKRFLENTDKKVGWKLFRNWSGGIGTIAGNISLYRARIGSDIPKADTDPLEKGYLDLGQTVDPSDIEDLRQKYEALLEEHGETRKIDDEVFSHYLSASNFDYSEQFPEFSELMTEELKTVLQQHFGSHVRPVTWNLKRTFNIPEDEVEDVGEWKWHLDFYTPELLRVFVLLKDTGLDQGPTYVINRSESRKIMKNHSYSDINTEEGVVEEKARVEALTGPAGTTYVLNPHQNIHKAGNVESGKERDVLVFTVGPSSSPLDADWGEHCEEYIKDYTELTGLGRLI